MPGLSECDEDSYGLDLECSPLAQVLKARELSPAYSWQAVEALGSGACGSKLGPWGMRPMGTLGLQPLLLFSSSGHKVASFTRLSSACYKPNAMGPTNQKPETLKSATKGLFWV